MENTERLERKYDDVNVRSDSATMYASDQIDGPSLFGTSHVLGSSGQASVTKVQASGKGRWNEFQDISDVSRASWLDSGFTGRAKSDPEDSQSDSDEGETAAAVAVFPQKLFAMLQDAENEGFAGVVSWDEGGNSFRVHRKLDFEQIILPKYFKMTKYKSFTRQLLNYCFTWAAKGPGKGGYFNPEFTRRSDPSKCHLLARRKRKRGTKKRARDDAKDFSKNGDESEDYIMSSQQQLQVHHGLEPQQVELPTIPVTTSVLEPRTIEEMITEPCFLGLPKES